jgi:hypothetical protein
MILRHLAHHLASLCVLWTALPIRQPLQNCFPKTGLLILIFKRLMNVICSQVVTKVAKPIFRSILRILFLATIAFLSSAGAAIVNGGFESGLEGWRPLFTREPQTGTVAVER